jgi:hypothetical protein
MHTYNRSGVQIEQCSGCRGIFLDYGELEHISQLESRFGGQAPPPPPAPTPTQPFPPAGGPVWGAPQQVHPGHHGGHHGGHRQNRRRGGMSGLFFSS